MVSEPAKDQVSQPASQPTSRSMEQNAAVLKQTYEHAYMHLGPEAACVNLQETLRPTRHHLSGVFIVSGRRSTADSNSRYAERVLMLRAVFVAIGRKRSQHLRKRDGMGIFFSFLNFGPPKKVLEKFSFPADQIDGNGTKLLLFDYIFDRFFTSRGGAFSVRKLFLETDS